MKKQLILSFLLWFPLLANARDLSPWYERNLELHPRATFLYQNYETIDTVHGNRHHPSNDLYLYLGISGAFSKYSIELDSTFANTRHMRFNIADVGLTGRYQWFNEDIGDCYSLVTSLTATQVFTLARNDLSNFYHGGIEIEADVSLGREVICEQFWQSRLWGVAGFGFADIGSPWVRFNAVWEHNWWDLHSAGIFLDTLWGLGHKGLRIHRHFHGYGPIRHQSVDLGLCYTYDTECFGIWTLGYSRRLYALNCPKHVNHFIVSIEYPFGL
jgi:hypothetical protein